VFDKVPAAPGTPEHIPGADKITIHEDTDGDGVIEMAEAEAAAEESAETIADLMGAGDNPAIEAVVEEEVFEALTEEEPA